MASDTEFRINQLFNTDPINKCFRELFYSTKGPEAISEKGPLKIILEEYLLIAAKGGGIAKLNIHLWTCSFYAINRQSKFQ